MNTIQKALYIEKVPEEPLPGMEYDLIFDGYSSMEQWADRSDLVQLNDQLQKGDLRIIKELPEEDELYTHIVLDTDGYYFAIVMKD